MLTNIRLEAQCTEVGSQEVKACVMSPPTSTEHPYHRETEGKIHSQGSGFGHVARVTIAIRVVAIVQTISPPLASCPGLAGVWGAGKRGSHTCCQQSLTTAVSPKETGSTQQGKETAVPTTTFLRTSYFRTALQGSPRSRLRGCPGATALSEKGFQSLGSAEAGAFHAYS